MESKKINQLATELAPELSDLTIIGDPTTGISKKITLSQMASLFTGTVEEYASLSAFPLVGAADTIYIALDTNIIYRWNTSTSAYVELSPNIVTSLVFNDANGFDGTISLVGSTATLTITTALTTGSVGFIGASGALTQDNSNFFWDNSNKRLGINTNAPTTALDVFGSGIIGRVNGTSTNNAFLGFASAGTNKWSIGNVQSDHRFRIYSESNTSELVSVLQTGEFGIGIANPTTKLHIDGGASALIANLDANVSVAKSISFRSDNSARINLEVSGTESGSNAGADFYLRAYTDAGALLSTPLTITRATGAAAFISTISATGAVLNGTGVSPVLLTLTSGNPNCDITLQSSASTNIVRLRNGTDDFQVFTNNVQRLVISSSGNLSVNTTATDYKMQITGNTNSSVLYLKSGGTAGYSSLLWAGDGGTTIGAMSTYNGEVLIGSSNVAIGTQGGTNGEIRITPYAAGILYLKDGFIGVGTSPVARVDLGADVGSAGSINKISLWKNGNTPKYGFGISNNQLDYVSDANHVFYTSATSRFKITSIGGFEFNTSGAGLLTIGASNSYAGISSGGGGVTLYMNGATRGGSGTAASGASVLAQDGDFYITNAAVNTIRFYFTSDNRLMIGRSSGSGALNVQGSIYLYETGAGAGNSTLKYNTSTGAVTYDTSARAYKKDIEDLNYGLAEILQMSPKKYKYISDDANDIGFIADEMYEIVPEIVALANNEIMNSDFEEGEPISINYDRFAPILVKAIQQQQTQIEELKALINK
jgi:hypothetical protein